MSDHNPRRRRSGSIRGAASEPLGLDPAADPMPDAAIPEPEAPELEAAEAVAPDLESEAPEPVSEPARTRRASRAAAAVAAVPVVPMIDPHGEATDVIADVPEMSVEDVEQRIGARVRERRVRTATAARTRTRGGANRRVILWRDSATILIFVVLALLAARYLLPSNDGTATASGTAGESAIVIGSVPADTGVQFSAAPTIGGIVPPSLRIDATPTPIPVITLPPPTPTPKPTATLKPGTTPKPSTGPGSTPGPTPTAAPVAAFSAACTATDTAHFDASASKPGTGATITTYDWAWSDGLSDSTSSPTIDHAFATSGSHTVILTIHNSTGGQDFVSHALSCP